MSPASVMTPSAALRLAMSPDGRSIYVPEDASSSPDVAQFDVGTDGRLVAKTVPEAAGGVAPYAAAVSPDGSSVYVANQAATISQYDVAAGGLLAPKSPATVTTAGAQFNAIAISPDGRGVYAPDSDNARVAQFDVGAGGRLAPKTPATVPAGPNSQGIAITPDGRSVYVTSTTGSSVAQYDVGAGGALAPKTPTSVPAGINAFGVAVSPDGRSAYVAQGGSVGQYDIGAGGALTAKSPATVPAGANDLVVSPDGSSVYATNPSGVSQYNVVAGGHLAAKSPASVPAGTSPFGVVATPDRGPVAAFSSKLGRAGSASRFDGAASSDSDGRIVRYDWDFGDGTTARSVLPAQSHVFKTAGNHAVSLTVTDDAGCHGALVYTGQTASCVASAGKLSRTLAIKPGAFGARTRVTIKLAKRRIRAKGPVALVVSNANGFRVGVKLSGAGPQRLKLKSKSFHVAAHAKRTVRMALPGPLRALLASRHTLRLRLKARVRDPSGHRRTVRKTVSPRLKR
jgi:DNA-binding beta-propeller fold protein YncE